MTNPHPEYRSTIRQKPDESLDFVSIPEDGSTGTPSFVINPETRPSGAKTVEPYNLVLQAVNIVDGQTIIMTAKTIVIEVTWLDPDPIVDPVIAEVKTPQTESTVTPAAATVEALIEEDLT